MKKTFFWDVALCSLIEVYRRFRGTYFLNQQDDICDKIDCITVHMLNIVRYMKYTHRPDDGVSKNLRNVGKHMPGLHVATF